jgi:hypothetical protein
VKKYILLFWKIFLYIILSLIALFVTIISFSYYYYSVWYSSVSLDEKVKVFSWITQSDFIVSDSWSTRRSGNTFLSIPEWYIVSISDDYTTWLEKWNNPSDFPYMQYLKDYWIMYGKITAIMDEQIPRDYEYHTMVRVIWLSTTLEFWLKATYEYTIWRITSLRSWKTPIDTYYTEISRKYVDFILLRPWYEFNYTDAIIGLQYNTWTSLVRSTERYLLYFGEFFIKKFYAKLIENAAKSSFAVPDIWTSVRGSFSADVDSLDPKNINITQDGIRVTRYYPFTEILPKILELPQSNIVDIAGNKKIVIETISTTEETSTWSIFSFTIPIDASKKRNYIYLKPESIKNYMNNSSVKISHIYDF